MNTPGLIERYLPTEPPVYRITDVPVEKWIDDGVEGLVVDVEDTVGIAGSEQLIAEYCAFLQGFRGERGIQDLTLATNHTVRNADDIELLTAWQQQTGADRVVTPMVSRVVTDDEPSDELIVFRSDDESRVAVPDPTRRKPSPWMILQTSQQNGIPISALGAIGDKATADVAAARYAGLEHIAWTRPFSGGQRHIGDRIIRDPVENILRVYAHYALNPVVRLELIHSTDEEFISSSETVEGERIVGLGVPEFDLTPAQLELLHTPRYRQALDELGRLMDETTADPRQKIQEFLYEHGRTMADALVYARAIQAAGIVALNFTSLSPELKHAIQTGLMILGYIEDGGDGFAARSHKDGATEEGGKLDQNVDKLLGAAADLFMLLPKGAITNTQAFLPLLRDGLLTLLRKPFRERGIPTKSVWSGKGSTLLLALSQAAHAFAGERYPVGTRRLRQVAVAAKIASAIHAPIVWCEDFEKAQHVANNKLRQAA